MLDHLRGRFGHVSNERLLSGQGLLNVAQTLAAIDGGTLAATTPEEVTQQARSDALPGLPRGAATFSALLGSAAGDLALTVGARGGVYVAGGAAPRLGTCSTGQRSGTGSPTKAGCGLPRADPGMAGPARRHRAPRRAHYRIDD